MRHAVIMAGGRGTRLWPLSVDDRPKQLLPLIDRGPEGRASLLELAASRLDGVIEPDRRYICTAERHRADVRAVCPGFDDDHILGEPEPRDTVNAIGLAAAVLAERDPDAVFAVLTSDHVIEPQAVFGERLRRGFELVEAEPRRLVTFGIEPTFPATGFGYIERGEALNGADDAFAVRRFVEKPDVERAQAYLDSGRHLWNSGMFVFHANTLLGLLAGYKPRTADGLRRIAAAWSTARRAEVLGEVFPNLEKVSVDYAVLEPASSDPSVEIVCVPMPVEWRDIGSWPSFAETLPPDGDGNRRSGGGETVFHGARGSLGVNEQGGHTLALLGCDDLIVVHTEHATLVAPRERAEEVKALEERLRRERLKRDA